MFSEVDINLYERDALRIQVEWSQLELFQDSLHRRQGWPLARGFAARQLAHHPAGAKMPGRGEISTLLPAEGLAPAVLSVCFASIDLHGGQYLLIKGFHFLSFQSDPFLPLVMHSHKIPALKRLELH